MLLSVMLCLSAVTQTVTLHIPVRGRGTDLELLTARGELGPCREGSGIKAPMPADYWLASLIQMSPHSVPAPCVHLCPKNQS